MLRWSCAGWTRPASRASRPWPATQPYAYRQPTDGADGWPTAAPEDVGLDRSAVEALVRAVAHDGAGLIHSLQIVRGGKLVLDEYFHGYTASDLHRLASATKSVASLLVGAAIDRGRIPGVDAPLLPLLGRSGDGAAPAWRKETLGDLLTMSMGLDWSAEEARSVHGTGPAFFEKVLAREVVTAPGTKWDYVSANVNLLAGVIFNATGVHADAFAREILFGPLGIATSDWEYGKERGYNLMDGSLQLRPRDLAKIGAMVAQGGRWNGAQVISEAWIRESTRSHLATGQPLGGYGYLWWTGELPSAGGVQPIVVANGMGKPVHRPLPRPRPGGGQHGRQRRQRTPHGSGDGADPHAPGLDVAGRRSRPGSRAITDGEVGRGSRRRAYPWVMGRSRRWPTADARPPLRRGPPRPLMSLSLLAALACGSDATGPEARYPEAAAHDIDAELLDQAYARARETSGIRSLLVQRDGVLIAEEYFQGAASDSLYQVWSVTKTITSILAGIALERGELTSLDQTLADFLRPVADSLPDDKGAISIRNLLT